MNSKNQNLITVRKTCFILFKRFFGIFLLVFGSCVDPVTPVFEPREGVVYVDAYISTASGASFVYISESILKPNGLKYEFVDGADVVYLNLDTGVRIDLMEGEGGYVPPNDFVATEGEEWELAITFQDGRQYKSRPELITTPVAFSNMKATYNPELLFRESSDAFLPGHFISIDLNDPANEDNYYFWRFRSFEPIEVCKSCTNQIYRDGECVDNPIRNNVEYKVDYVCDSDCWQIRYNEAVNVFTDEFSNGNTINALPVGNVLLYSKEDIVVEMQQYSLSPNAYEYYKVLKDLVDNNSGLNAPPPAALVGNMFNPNNSEEVVLGRFTAAAVTTESLFIDRTPIKEAAIDGRISIDVETCGLVCPPIACRPGYLGPVCPIIRTTTCLENRFQTSVEPENWIKQEN